MTRKKWRSWDANLSEDNRRRLLEMKQDMLKIRKAAHLAKKRERRAKMSA